MERNYKKIIFLSFLLFLGLLSIILIFRNQQRIKGEIFNFPLCSEEEFNNKELECSECQFNAPRTPGIKICTVKESGEKCKKECACDVSEVPRGCDLISGKRRIDVYECSNYSYYYEEICVGLPSITNVYLSQNPNKQFGPPGSEITILGNNFTENFEVKISGIKAEILQSSSNRLILKIPQNVSGCSNDIEFIRTITYLDKDGQEKSQTHRASYSNFTVVPKISFETLENRIKFSPTEGVEGSIIKIISDTGGFGNQRNNRWVEIGGKIVEFYPPKDDIIDTWQDNQILAAVPFGAKTGKIRVYACSSNIQAYAESDEIFKVLHYPKISLISPNFGFSGDKFIIYGNNFSGEGIRNLKVYFIFDNTKEYELSNIINKDKFKIEIEITKSDENNIKQNREYNFSSKNNKVKIKVCTNKGCVESKEWFYLQSYPLSVLYPMIKDVSIPKGENFKYLPSQKIEIYGRNFGNSGIVRFKSGEQINNFLIWKDNHIEFILPNFDSNKKEYTLPLEVCTKFGCSKSNLNYIYSYNEIYFNKENSDYFKSLNGVDEVVYYKPSPEVYEIKPLCINYGGKIKIYGKNLINSKVYFKTKNSNWIETPEYYTKDLDYLEVKVPENRTSIITSELKIINYVPYIKKNEEGRYVKEYQRFETYTKQKLYISSNCIDFNCSTDPTFPYIQKIVNTGSLEESKGFVAENEKLHLNKGIKNLGVVKIIGCNFGDNPRSSFVLFNDTKQIKNFENPRIYSWSNSEIILRVPFGATSGNLKVMIFTGNDYLQSNSKFFNVLPTIQKVLPKSGFQGQFITIFGSDFCEHKNCSKKANIKFGVWTKGDFRFNGRISIPGKLINLNNIYLFSSKKIVLKLEDVISGMIQIIRPDNEKSMPLNLASNYLKDRVLNENNYFEKIPKIDYISPKIVNQNKDNTIRIYGKGFNSIKDLVLSKNEYKDEVKTELSELISKSKIEDALRVKIYNYYIKPVYQYKDNLRQNAGFVLSKYFEFGRHNLILENFDGAFYMYRRYGYDKPIDRVINSVYFYDLLDESKVYKIQGDSIKEFENQYYMVLSLEIGCQTSECPISKMRDYQGEFLDDVYLISDIKQFTRIYKGKKYKLSGFDNQGYVREYLVVYPLKLIFEKNNEKGYFKIDNFSIDIFLPYTNKFSRIKCSILRNNIDFSKQSLKTFLQNNISCKYLNSIKRYIHNNKVLEPGEPKKELNDKVFSYGAFEDNYILVDLPIPKIDKVYFNEQERILTILGDGFTKTSKVILGKWELKPEADYNIIKVKIPKNLDSGVYEIYVKNQGFKDLLDKNSNVVNIEIK